MGTILQQSVLKGRQRINNEKEKNLLHELFTQAAVNYSNQVAIYYKDDNGQEYVISYEQLNEITNKLARVFQKLEKSEDASKSFVAVCMKPSHQLPTVLIAILKAGMAYLPLDAEFPMVRMKHILEEAKPFVVVIEQEINVFLHS